MCHSEARFSTKGTGAIFVYFFFFFELADWQNPAHIKLIVRIFCPLLLWAEKGKGRLVPFIELISECRLAAVSLHLFN